MSLPVTYCTIEGCEKKNFGKGMCNMHYTRARNYGSPHIVKIVRGDQDLAFWSKVEKTDECWNWTAYKNPLGYGSIYRDGKVFSAHRASYVMEFGEIPEGMDIDHQCHNTSCVNPAHLKAMTRKENAENRAGAEVRSKSGVRGVGWVERLNSWCVQVKHHGKNHHIKGFENLAQAERAAITKRNELFTNSTKDRGIVENVRGTCEWHNHAHPQEWKDCVYEPCSLTAPEWREAWS